MAGYYWFLHYLSSTFRKTLICSALALLISIAHAQVNFNKPDFDTGKGPVSIAAADFNRDGLLDVVTANSRDNNITVLLNNGNATFGRRTDYSTGQKPVAVVTADFNNDSFADVAVANQTDSTITIFLGNGDGTLRSSATFTVGSKPDALITADFNKDGKADLVVVNNASNTFSVFLGNGDGTFTLNADYPAGPDFNNFLLADDIVTADFNGDGIADLAVTNGRSDNVSIFLGKGDGTFRAAGSFNLLGGARGIADGHMLAADFNQDGKVDLLVQFDDCTQRGCNQGARIFAGHGDGTFDVGHSFPFNDFNPPMVAVDLNGDHVPDVVIPGRVVLVNPATVFSGSATFIPMFPAGLLPASLVAGDFSGDGKMDIVTANSEDDTVSLLQGNGDGTFHQLLRSPFPDQTSLEEIVSADFNRDGVPDVLLRGISTKGFWLYLANGDGSFRVPVHMSADFDSTFALAAVDVNRDGIPDIVVNGFFNNGARGVTRVFLGNGDGTFRAPIDSDTRPSSSMRLADVNGDGIPDVILLTFDNTTPGSLSEAIHVYFGVGNGTFLPPVKTTIPFGSTTMVAGDFNGDGKMDVAVGFSNIGDNGNSFTIYLGNGDGTFRAGQHQPVPDAASPLATADLNRDGRLDMVVGHGDVFGAVAVFLGNGDGTFTQKQDVQTFDKPRDVQVADLNKDGVPDIVVANGRVSVLLGRGDGTFSARQDFAVGGALQAVIGDFNRDGAPDIAVASSDFTNGSLSLMLSGNGPPLGRDFHLNLNPSSATVKAGQSATTSASIVAIGSFKDSVTLSCTGLPSGATCSFNPAALSPGANGQATSTLTITTTARSSSSLVPTGNSTVAFALGLPVCGIVFARLRVRNRWKLALLFTLLLLALVLLQGCGGLGGGGGTGGGGGGTGGGGGGGGNSGGGTPSGTVTVTVTATSGGSPVLTHSLPLTLNVQ